MSAIRVHSNRKSTLCQEFEMFLSLGKTNLHGIENIIFIIIDYIYIKLFNKIVYWRVVGKYSPEMVNRMSTTEYSLQTSRIYPE